MTALRHTVRALAAVVLVAGCTTPPPAPAPDPPTSAPAASAPAAPAWPVRDCGSSTTIVSGSDPQGPVSVGPVSFAPLDYRFGEPDPFSRDPDPDGWRSYKVVLLVHNGVRATLTIPGSHRDLAALTYGHGRHHTVSFETCDPAAGVTQYNGGFVLRRPACVPVDVTWDGTTRRVDLDFAAGGC